MVDMCTLSPTKSSLGAGAAAPIAPSSRRRSSRQTLTDNPVPADRSSGGSSATPIRTDSIAQSGPCYAGTLSEGTWSPSTSRARFTTPLMAGGLALTTHVGLAHSLRFAVRIPARPLRLPAMTESPRTRPLAIATLHAVDWPRFLTCHNRLIARLSMSVLFRLRTYYGTCTQHSCSERRSSERRRDKEPHSELH